MAELLPFKQGVPGSSPGRVTIFLDTRSSSEKNKSLLSFVIDPPKEVCNVAPDEYGAVVVLLVLAITALFFHERVWGLAKTVVIAVISSGLL